MCAPDSASVASGRVGAHGGCVRQCKRSACTAAPANGRTANESQPSGYTASSPSCPRPESPRSRMGNLGRASLKFECGQFLRYRDVLEDHVAGKAVLERREIFAPDQRRQIVAAFKL